MWGFIRCIDTYSEEHNTHLSYAVQVHLLKYSTVPDPVFILVNVKVTDVSVYFFKIG